MHYTSKMQVTDQTQRQRRKPTVTAHLDSGELTPSLKLKRNVICEKHKTMIRNIFDTKD